MSNSYLLQYRSNVYVSKLNTSHVVLRHWGQTAQKILHWENCTQCECPNGAYSSRASFWTNSEVHLEYWHAKDLSNNSTAEMVKFQSTGMFSEATQIYMIKSKSHRMKTQSTPPVLSSGHILAYVLCHCLQDLKVLTHPGESHRAPMMHH